MQTSTGQPKRAARVLGAADALLETSGARLNWHDRLYYDSSIKTTRDQLDQITFAAAWAEGRVMQTEQAIAYALAEPVSEPGAQHPLPSLTPLRAAKEQFGGLTAREREVAALVAQGSSNREIAKLLVVSERTVGAHISNILSKLEFASRTQIATWAIAKGLSKSPGKLAQPTKSVAKGPHALCTGLLCCPNTVPHSLTVKSVCRCAKPRYFSR